MLQFYALWIDAQTSKSVNAANSFVSMKDMLGALHGYSYRDIWNDFHHLRECHQTASCAFFKANCVTQCDEHNCRSLTRNTRDRNRCKDKVYRRSLYFIRDERDHVSDEEADDVKLQELLDTIHSYLLHCDVKHMVLGHKFVTRINSDDDEKQEAEESREYGFGVGFSYWHKHWNHHCPTKYGSLKQELLSNAAYTLDQFQYDLFAKAARAFLQTERCKAIQAKKHVGWNEYLKIDVGASIQCKHILVLMTYTNHDDLQRHFKATYRKIRFDETRKEVMMRHREIANWAACFLEIMNFFSDTAQQGKVFYHGVDDRLQFSRFQVGFLIPASTTLERKIAYNFASAKGLIICMTPVVSARILDVSFLSHFPKEEERIIFHNTWSFCDIIYNGMSTQYHIKCLKLYQKLMSGSYVSHDKTMFKRAHLKTLVRMMDNYICIRRGTKAAYEDVSSYLQGLFNYYTDGLRVIWINATEFKKVAKLNPEFATCICVDETLSVGSFSQFLFESKGVNVQPVCCGKMHRACADDAKLDLKKEITRVIECGLGHISKRMVGEIVVFRASWSEQHVVVDIKSKPDCIQLLQFETDFRCKEIGLYRESKDDVSEVGTSVGCPIKTSALRGLSRIGLDIIIRVISCSDKHGNENESIVF